MIVIGIDIGFSQKRPTCCSCVLRFESDSVDILEGPKRFSIIERSDELSRLLKRYGEPDLMAIDAPLTPKRLRTLPQVGRSVDRVFSRGLFSHHHRGPQPGSIRTPLQGWPLYQAGMDFKSSMEETLKTCRYTSFGELATKAERGGIEVIPKLTQTVLLSRAAIAGRPAGANIDEHLFPQLFTPSEGKNPTLRGIVFCRSVIELLTQIVQNPHSHHEELAAFVAAFQGVLCLRGDAIAVGCAGEYEGYFALPTFKLWHCDWQNAYACIDHNGCSEVPILANSCKH